MMNYTVIYVTKTKHKHNNKINVYNRKCITPTRDCGKLFYENSDTK